MQGAKQTGEPLDYAASVLMLRAHEPELAEKLVDFHGVEEVLQWMQQQGLCHAPVDIVGQDEFNYDFLLQFGASGRWLAFGVT
jgi:hypothetical protein